MDDFIKSCLQAAIEIDSLLAQSSHESLAKSLKRGYGGDMSHEVDLKAEQIFYKHLHQYGQIFSEESGNLGENAKHRIVIDPIDGSDNFLSQIPYFGSSVALMEEGKCLQTFVCNYASKEVFFKSDAKAKKTFLYEDSIQELRVNPYSSCGIFESVYKSETYVSRLKKEKIKYRSPGAIALSLAYASNVDFVLYEGGVREFDILAGWELCEGLYKKMTDNYLFVSKDKQIFDTIVQKVLKEESR